jgi:hypothetical protein
MWHVWVRRGTNTSGGMPLKKRSLGRHRRRWEDNKMVKEIGWKVVK